MSGWPENWAQARPTSAARDRRPAGPFLGGAPLPLPRPPAVCLGQGPRRPQLLQPRAGGRVPRPGHAAASIHTLILRLLLA